MTVQFGEQQRPPSQMPAVAEAHASTIAAAIDRGWIVRGIKLGIGFWLAGMIIAMISILFWFFVISGSIAMFARAGQDLDAAEEARADAAALNVGQPVGIIDEALPPAPSIDGPTSVANSVPPSGSLRFGDAIFEDGKLAVVVENISPIDASSLVVTCSIVSAEDEVLEVRSSAGRLNAFAKGLVPLSPNIEPYFLTGHDCRAAG